MLATEYFKKSQKGLIANIYHTQSNLIKKVKKEKCGIFIIPEELNYKKDGQTIELRIIILNNFMQHKKNNLQWLNDNYNSNKCHLVIAYNTFLDNSRYHFDYNIKIKEDYTSEINIKDTLDLLPLLDDGSIDFFIKYVTQYSVNKEMWESKAMNEIVEFNYSSMCGKIDHYGIKDSKKKYDHKEEGYKKWILERILLTTITSPVSKNRKWLAFMMCTGICGLHNLTLDAILRYDNIEHDYKNKYKVNYMTGAYAARAADGIVKTVEINVEKTWIANMIDSACRKYFKDELDWQNFQTELIQTMRFYRLGGYIIRNSCMILDLLIVAKICGKCHTSKNGYKFEIKTCSRSLCQIGLMMTVARYDMYTALLVFRGINSNVVAPRYEAKLCKDIIKEKGYKAGELPVYMTLGLEQNSNVDDFKIGSCFINDTSQDRNLDEIIVMTTKLHFDLLFGLSGVRSKVFNILEKYTQHKIMAQIKVTDNA